MLQDNKNCLRDFLSQVWSARVAQRNRVNPVDVPRDQSAKRVLRIVFNVCAQQGGVICFLHLPTNAANPEKRTDYFMGSSGLRKPAALIR